MAVGAVGFCEQQALGAASRVAAEDPLPAQVPLALAGRDSGVKAVALAAAWHHGDLMAQPPTEFPRPARIGDHPAVEKHFWKGLLFELHVGKFLRDVHD